MTATRQGLLQEAVAEYRCCCRYTREPHGKAQATRAEQVGTMGAKIRLLVNLRTSLPPVRPETGEFPPLRRLLRPERCVPRRTAHLLCATLLQTWGYPAEP